MKVTLVNCTPHALESLIFTKSTRLKMHANLFEEIKAWPLEKKLAEWEYMQNTIKSSWEFVDYLFLIEGVTRAFTHQLVRHRVGTSFAQQAQRVVNMSDFEFVTTGNIVGDEHRQTLYNAVMAGINVGYQGLIELETNPQDARGVLPTNICTNICFKANLRTLNGMSGERLCVKAQGEFQDVMRQIRQIVIAEHPWAEKALRVFCAQHGVCAFPAYKDCPIKGGIFDPETGYRYDGNTTLRPDTKEEIQQLWQITRAEAQPTAPKE